MERDNKKLTEKLRDRQNQFGALVDISPEKLRGLKFCNDCDGVDHEWTDWTGTEIDAEGLEIYTIKEVIEYRAYLASVSCQTCGGTGFEGGSFQLSIDQWLNLGTAVE